MAHRADATRRPVIRRLLGVGGLLVALAAMVSIVLAVATETGVIGARAGASPAREDDARYSVTVLAMSGSGHEWRSLAALERPARAVLLIHGLDEPGTIWDDLAPALAQSGHTVLRFDYPNDQAIRDSADLLIHALRSLRARGCRRIDIVCHSMGGLVARDALSRALDRGGVTPDERPRADRVITVGTPNRGSPLASLRGVAEAREQIMRWARSLNDPPPIDAYLADGRGEAGADLAPGSPYLAELNARALPRDVAFTIIAGRLAPLDENDVRGLVDWTVVRWFAGAQDVERVAEAINLLGDGVVPLDSALLDGVEDFVVVEANHRALLKSAAIEQAVRDAAGVERSVPPAIPIILDRLARDQQ